MDGIKYLDSLAPWKGHGSFSLEPMKRLMSVMGDPQDRVPSIHIAGTNGKGSISAAIASTFGAAGFRVGLNTSPHLRSPNERIVIDGLPLSDALMNRYALEIKRAAEEINIVPSYFEAITAIAFLCFATEKLDWTVIETGLGGRLDATNTISNPRATVIASIDRDHEHILGEGVLSISREKAGIIKPGSPLVCGKIDDVPFKEIKRIASDVRSGLVRRFGSDFSASLKSGCLEFSGSDGFELTCNPALQGPHQASNMAVAIEVCHIVGASAADCSLGVNRVFWPGRLEQGTIGQHDLIVDCAHNPAGIEALVSHLKANNLYQCSICFGAIETKDWRTMVELLVPYASNWHILSPETSNSVSPEAIGDHLSGFGVTAKLWHRQYADFANYMRRAGSETVLVTGSIYMVGRMRSFLGFSDKPIWRRHDPS
jgi:dihydrofolate synthase/folylpolyglutamate synthase